MGVDDQPDRKEQHIVDHITGYGHFHKHFHTRLEERELATPLTTELDTQAFWLTIDRWLEKRLLEGGVQPLASLHAAERCRDETIFGLRTKIWDFKN